MRVSTIQPAVCRLQTIKKTTNQHQPTTTQEPIETPNFKGKGGGFLAGLGTGVCGGLIALVGAATAGVTVPLAVAGLAMLGTGVAGGAIGNKIEDKIDEFWNNGKDNSKKE